MRDRDDVYRRIEERKIVLSAEKQTERDRALAEKQTRETRENQLRLEAEEKYSDQINRVVDQMNDPELEGLLCELWKRFAPQEKMVTLEKPSRNSSGKTIFVPASFDLSREYPALRPVEEGTEVVEFRPTSGRIFIESLGLEIFFRTVNQQQQFKLSVNSYEPVDLDSLDSFKETLIDIIARVDINESEGVGYHGPLGGNLGLSGSYSGGRDY